MFARNPDRLDLAVLGKDLDDVGFAATTDLGYGTDDAAVVLTSHLFDGLAQGKSVALHRGERRWWGFVCNNFHTLRRNTLTAGGQRRRDQQYCRQGAHGVT